MHGMVEGEDIKYPTPAEEYDRYMRVLGEYKSGKATIPSSLGFQDVVDRAARMAQAIEPKASTQLKLEVYKLATGIVMTTTFLRLDGARVIAGQIVGSYLDLLAIKARRR